MRERVTFLGGEAERRGCELSIVGLGYAIEVQGLRKSYGSLVAVDGISFTLESVRSSASWGRTAPARPRPSRSWRGSAMFRWLKVRGRLVETTTKGAAEHIDRLSLRYTGNPKYQSSQPGEQRITLKVEPVRVSPSWGSWE
jgi:hypothetical protein